MDRSYTENNSNEWVVKVLQDGHQFPEQEFVEEAPALPSQNGRGKVNH